MIEEELRRKEKEMTEEEKIQKMIEERRRRRQAILEKYKQDKNENKSDQPKPAETALNTTATNDTETAQAKVPQQQEVPHMVTAAPSINGTADAKEEIIAAGQDTTKGHDTISPNTHDQKEPKTVTHFDMFAELPSTLIPSAEVRHHLQGTELGTHTTWKQALNRHGGAITTGEDELNLQDNWDDEEGYYGT